ncbi:hypothetical protein [Actinomadura harenae]|nr:hypothetical protein [Actinomadura harenae]
MSVLAAAGQQESAGATLLLLVGGLFATTVGILTWTNYRGFRDRFGQEAQRSAGLLERIPPWRLMKRSDPGPAQIYVRVVGPVFAVLGSVLVLTTIVRLVRHPPRWTMPHPHPHFEPFYAAIGVVMVVPVVLILWRGREEGGPFGDAWVRGGISRVGCLLIGLGGLVMAGGAATGIFQAFGAGWAVGAVGAVIVMLTSVRKDGGDHPPLDQRIRSRSRRPPGGGR